VQAPLTQQLQRQSSISSTLVMNYICLLIIDNDGLVTEVQTAYQRCSLHTLYQEQPTVTARTLQLLSKYDVSWLKLRLKRTFPQDTSY
jgi:hypothetical protein